MNSETSHEVTYAQAVAEALNEEMAVDPDIVLLGEDVGSGGIFRATAGLLEEFGEGRVRDTPISESAIIGAALGASLMGLKPVAEIMYIDFITIAMDQIVNQVAKWRYMFGQETRLPIVIRTQGGTGRHNAAQHSQSLEAWFVHIPGLKVVMPSTPHDAKGLLKSAIRDGNPVLFIEHKALYFTRGLVPNGEYTVPLGKAILRKEGDDVTLIATSAMLLRAMAAAEALERQGLGVEVIDPLTLFPLDAETIISSVRKTGKVIVVHEACKRGGVGAEIAAMIMEEAFDYLDAPVLRLAGADTPVPYSVEDAAIPSQARIEEAIVAITDGGF